MVATYAFGSYIFGAVSYLPERCMQWPARRAGTAQEQRKQRSQLTEQDTERSVACLLLLRDEVVFVKRSVGAVVTSDVVLVFGPNDSSVRSRS